MSEEAAIQDLLDELSHKPPGSRVAGIIRYYRQTGTVRRRELRRLFGTQAENDALLKSVLDALEQVEATEHSTARGRRPRG
jgi:hypothetical protein